jgi:hypothetical protein
VLEGIPELGFAALDITASRPPAQKYSRTSEHTAGACALLFVLQSTDMTLEPAVKDWAVWKFWPQNTTTLTRLAALDREGFISHNTS